MAKDRYAPPDGVHLPGHVGLVKEIKEQCARLEAYCFHVLHSTRMVLHGTRMGSCLDCHFHSSGLYMVYKLYPLAVLHEAPS